MNNPQENLDKPPFIPEAPEPAGDFEREGQEQADAAELLEAYERLAEQRSGSGPKPEKTIDPNYQALRESDANHFLSHPAEKPAAVNEEIQEIIRAHKNPKDALNDLISQGKYETGGDFHQAVEALSRLQGEDTPEK
jgi:hypothetical protein